MPAINRTLADLISLCQAAKDAEPNATAKAAYQNVLNVLTNTNIIIPPTFTCPEATGAITPIQTRIIDIVRIGEGIPSLVTDRQLLYMLAAYDAVQPSMTTAEILNRVKASVAAGAFIP